MVHETSINDPVSNKRLVGTVSGFEKSDGQCCGSSLKEGNFCMDV